MKEETANPLEQLTGYFRRHVTRRDCQVFCLSFLLILLVHLYLFTHKFINHDDVESLLNNLRIMVRYGRWMQPLLKALTGPFSSSWLGGILGSVFLAGSAVLLARLFEVRHLSAALLLSVTLVSFPAVASTFAYMFVAYCYFFALFLSVLGAWLIHRQTLSGLLGGAVCITLAMGAYQAYFCMAAALLVLSLCVEICRGRWEGSARPVLFAGLRYLGALAAGMLLYMAVTRLVLLVTEETMLSYAGLDAMGRLSLGQVPHRVYTAYRNFARFCLNRAVPMFHGWFPMLACLVLLLDVLSAFWAVKRIGLHRRMPLLLILAGLICIMPLACGLIYVMTEESTVHLLMLYPMVIPFLVPAVVLDGLSLPKNGGGLSRRIGAGFAAALLAAQLLCGYEFVVITNRAYFVMEMNYESVYAFYLRLLTKIELQEGYTRETPVAMLGRAKPEVNYPAVNMTGINNGDSALNLYSRKSYLLYFMGSNLRFADDATCAALRESRQFQAMPCYPAEGSVASINGVVVVKLSEED